MESYQAINPSDWNTLITSIPGARAHIFQTRQWGEFKQKYGWRTSTYIWKDDVGATQAAALILQRSMSLLGITFQVLYCPKGPTLDWQNASLVERVLNNLEKFATDQSAIFIKVDPDVPLGWGIPGEEDAKEFPEGHTLQTDLRARKWHFSRDQIQFRNTVLIDLNLGEEELLAKMKQKTRYNIRLAEKKRVMVHSGGLADLEMLYKMYAETSVRDGFLIRSADYYLTLWRSFIEAGMAEPLIAEVDGQAIAAIFIFHFNGISRYIYGMSREQHRDLMPNYLLQWEAIKRSKELGCHNYDMWGAPDMFDESDPLWGVYRFKEGFNGTVMRTLGAWDFTSRPLLYKLYTTILPRILNIMRKRGNDQTERSLNS
jgi:peptidoglycan pentaglycine glycine transferase (the first glycine)